MDEIINDWQKNASKRKDQNFMFIRSLKFKHAAKVDRLAFALHQEAFEKIDCLKCGNCCKVSKPLLSEKDIKRISEHFKEDISKIKSKYLEEDEDGDWTFNKLPCPFLGEDNRCEIYSVRPKDCQEFPHTNKKHFATRSHSHSFNTTICPAVYYIVEKMQEHKRI